MIDEDNLDVDYLPVIREALTRGIESVMVDGSRLSLDDNIEATRRVAEMAHAANTPCEAELGVVLGHESGPLPPYEELFALGKGFTDVEEALRFAAETGCDWLSVAIGNIHGAISGVARDEKKPEARLQVQHLELLGEATGLPLVLHGGSSVKQEYLLEAIKRGIAKVRSARKSARRMRRSCARIAMWPQRNRPSMIGRAGCCAITSALRERARLFL